MCPYPSPGEYRFMLLDNGLKVRPGKDLLGQGPHLFFHSLAHRCLHIILRDLLRLHEDQAWWPHRSWEHDKKPDPCQDEKYKRHTHPIPFLDEGIHEILNAYSPFLFCQYRTSTVIVYRFSRAVPEVLYFVWRCSYIRSPVKYSMGFQVSEIFALESVSSSPDVPMEGLRFEIDNTCGRRPCLHPLSYP